MATVTIHDAARAKVLARAAWMTAVDALGNCEDYVVWLDQADEEFDTTRETIEERVALYTGAAALMREIESAPVGETVKIDADTQKNIAALHEGLADDVTSGSSKEERLRLLGLYEAAESLLPAEAVA